ncbi:uncharacterized protein LOC144367248 [Ictidomys tridecemlineatus]
MMTIFYIYMVSPPPTPPNPGGIAGSKSAAGGRAVGLTGMPTHSLVPVLSKQQGELRTSPAQGPSAASSPGAPRMGWVPSHASRLLKPVPAGPAPGRSRRLSRLIPAAEEARELPEQELEATGRGADGQGQPRARNPRRQRLGEQHGSQGARGAGRGSNKEPFLSCRRPARARPSPLSAVRRGPGRQRGGAPGPRLPSPPRRPLAPGGGRGGGRRLRVPPPRAPPPPGLLAAIPTLLPRLQQLRVAHGLGGDGGRGERGPVERQPGARPRRAPLRERPRKLREEEEKPEEAVGGGGCRGTRSAPRPLRPLPSLSLALFSHTPGRRLGFVRGDGVALWPPKQEPDTCLPSPSCVPAPGGETPSARRPPAAGEASTPPAP